MFYNRSIPKRLIEEVVKAPAGEKVKIEYGIKLDSNGHKTVYEKGKTDLYERIQSHAEECKIENIIKRYAMGDLTALSKNEAQYGDFTGLPKTMAEYLNLAHERTAAFEKLPLEVRAEFNHNPEEYIASLGTNKIKEVAEKFEKMEVKADVTRPETVSVGTVNIK